MMTSELVTVMVVVASSIVAAQADAPARSIALGIAAWALVLLARRLVGG